VAQKCATFFFASKKVIAQVSNMEVQINKDFLVVAKGPNNLCEKVLYA